MDSYQKVHEFELFKDSVVGVISFVKPERPWKFNQSNGNYASCEMARMS